MRPRGLAAHNAHCGPRLSPTARTPVTQRPWWSACCPPYQQIAWATESGIDATSASVASHLAGPGTQICFCGLPGTLGSSPASPTLPSCLLPGLMCSKPLAPFCLSRWELGCAFKAFCTGYSLCPELFCPEGRFLLLVSRVHLLGEPFSFYRN